MKIAVVGAGALGQFYGAQLLLAGHEVHFIARRDAERLRNHGLSVFQTPTPQIASSQQHPHLQLSSLCVSTDGASIGPVDWVVVTLKTTALDVLKDLLPSLRGPQTRLTVLCNGLYIEERISAWVPAELVFGQLCFVCVNREQDGTIRHFAHGAVAVASPCGAAVDDLADLWKHAGVKCYRPASLLEARWKKLVWNIPFNGLATLHNVTTDKLLSEHYDELRFLMRETIAIANADLQAAGVGHQIDQAFIDTQLDLTQEMGSYAPSTLLDARAGLPLEWDSVFLEPLLQAKRLGVSAPNLDRLVTALAPFG